MRVYVDTSALLKRVFAERESPALVSFLVEHVEAGTALASSSLAWIEVSRAVRAYAGSQDTRPDEDLVEIAVSGLLEKPISSEVVALARRIGPRAVSYTHL